MTFKDVTDEGRDMLGLRHVQPSVLSSLKEVLVEGTFPSGTLLVAVEKPICSLDGCLKKALRGSFLPEPTPDMFEEIDPKFYDKDMQPGAIIPAEDEDILLHEGRERILMCIKNTGDRPIQVCLTFSPSNTKCK
jgi:urease